MMCNNTNLDLVSINAYAKFGQILSICSQNIEQKQNYDGQNDRQMDGMMDGRQNLMDYPNTVNPHPCFFKVGL